MDSCLSVKSGADGMAEVSGAGSSRRSPCLGLLLLVGGNQCVAVDKLTGAVCAWVGHLQIHLERGLWALPGREGHRPSVWSSDVIDIFIICIHSSVRCFYPQTLRVRSSLKLQSIHSTSMSTSQF